MNSSPSNDEPMKSKPEKVQLITIITLISGIINLLYGLGFTFLIILGTIGFGIICAPITILPAVLGLFEIIFAAKLLGDSPRKPGNLQVLAILEIVAIITGNIFSVAAGILNLVFMNNPEVASYLASLPA